MAGRDTFDKRPPYILVIETINARGLAYTNNSRGKRLTMEPDKSLYPKILFYSKCYPKIQKDPTLHL